MSSAAFIPKAVIDTSPLFTILTLNFTRRSPFTEQKRQAILRGASLDPAIINSPSRQENYLQLFTSIQKLLTTSHVIGELQGLQKRGGLFGEDLKSFWLSAMELLRLRDLDERLLSLLDLSAKDYSKSAVCEIGPTDAALIELALREGCILLTDDERTLYRLALRVGVKCELVKNLVG